MFHRWGFLLTEMWGLLILAALVGLLAGWILWGRRGAAGAADDVARLRADLAACTAKSSDLAAQLVSAQSEKAEAEARMASAMVAEAAATVSAALSHAAAPAPLAAMAAPVAPPAAVAPPIAPVAAAAVAKPQSLTAARGGKPDDLKLIKGIGPKLEILCNRLGFYHFDQIAAWTAAEIAWVDDNLEGFKGRVSRDNWVAQARALASGN